MIAFITGAAGFIGRHLITKILENGDSVVGLDNLSTGSLRNIQNFDPKLFRLVRGDTRDSVLVDRWVAECDVVYHLAAVVGVKNVVEHPVNTLEVNLGGTETVLKSALRYSKPVYIASTSEVYGKGISLPFREEDDVVLGPTNKLRWGYAASKMVDEFLAISYFREYNLPVIIGRHFNTIGPFQTGQYGMVVPRFVENALAGNPLQIYGDGCQTRCFCDVRDVVNAMLLLMDLCKRNQYLGEVFNIGTDTEVSINTLAKEVIPGALGLTVKVEYIRYEDVYGRDFEDMNRRKPLLVKIGNLGWLPKVSLESTILDIARSMGYPNE